MVIFKELGKASEISGPRPQKLSIGRLGFRQNLTYTVDIRHPRMSFYT